MVLSISNILKLHSSETKKVWIKISWMSGGMLEHINQFGAQVLITFECCRRNSGWVECGVDLGIRRVPSSNVHTISR